MKNDKHSSIPRIFIITSFVIGLVLAAFGIASGSNPLVKPDVAAYEKQLQSNPVQPEQLSAWLVEGRRDFQVAGFLSADACAAQKRTTAAFKCYDSEDVKDNFWVRKTFRNQDMPLIVYGSDSADGLAAAVQLKHLGYQVRYLESGFNGFAERILNQESVSSHFFTLNDPLVKKKGQQWVVAGADNKEIEDEEVELGEDKAKDTDEEEDEEQEEGC